MGLRAFCLKTEYCLNVYLRAVAENISIFCRNHYES